MRIGLTGGIGSGKSTVAKILATLGGAVIDTDAIARALTLPGGAALHALRLTFGDGMFAPDGALNRAAMRSLAFGDASAKAKLEAVLHPLIGEEAMRQAQIARESGSRVCVFDVPLLAESRVWRDRVDRVLVVDCSEATQVERVSTRPGWNAQTAQRVIAQQATRAQRRRVADAVIHNDGVGLDDLAAKVSGLWRAWAPAR